MLDVCKEGMPCSRTLPA